MEKIKKVHCQICGEDVHRNYFSPHLAKSHTGVSLAEYYVLYIDTSQNGLCKFCEINPVEFIGISKGFKKNCSDSVCHSKSVNPYSKEYKMKIDGLSESQYLEWTKTDSKSRGKAILDGFSRARDENPNFDKENSRYCKEFWMKKGHSETESSALAHQETEKNRNKLKDIKKDDPDYQKGKSWNSYKYWMVKGMSEEDAKKHVSEKQGTFSLKKCIEKHGEEIGKKIWTERQEKWMKANKKTNFSKISQDLFWKIVGREPLLLENCRFATNSNGEKDLSGANHEFTINLESMIIKPDFILVSKNRIIEFDGEYWHSEKSCGTRSSKRIWNPDRESKKESEMLKMGYELLRVGEREYMNSPETIIQKCLQFLNG
jgi:hypothetical protein